MRTLTRAATVIAATAGGVALLANFRTTPGGTMLSTGASAAVPGTTRAPAIGDRSATAVVPTTTGATNGSAASGASRTVDGPVVNTRYGPVQVRVTVQGSKILDVQALELPSDRSKSQRISQAAGPLLRNEVLQAQTANIHIVSGASYTSTGYAQSLQGALDLAKK
jgi:uncharacterized protein with FMN-binding domain